MPRKVLPRHRSRIRHDLRRRTRSHDLPAILTRARPNIEHVIRLANRVLIVLHHQHRVAQIAQVFERRDQPLIIPLMQPDRRLIQHIQHAPQPRSDLCRQPNPLSFAARKRCRTAIERQISESHRIQKLQPLDDLPLQSVRDQPIPSHELHRPRAHQRPLQGQPGEVRNRCIPPRIGRLHRLRLILRRRWMHRRAGQRNRHRQRLRPQSPPMASRTLGRRHELHHVLAIALRLRILERLAQPVEDAVKTRSPHFIARRPIQQQILFLLTELRERLLQINLVLLRRQLDQPQQILRRRPRPHRPIQQRL